MKTEKMSNPFNVSFAKWPLWSFCILTVAATVWGMSEAFPFLVAKLSIMGLLAEIFFRLFPIVFAVLASLIINRQPTNTVGWLMMLPAIGGITTFISEAYFRNVLGPPQTFSFLFLLMLMINNAAWTLFIFPIILIPLFFPNGRPPSVRWNWAAYYAAVLLILFYGIGIFSSQVGPDDVSWTITNPFGFVSKETNDFVFGWPWASALVLLTVACMAALVSRYRRGTQVERTQIKWVVYACLCFGIVYISLIPVSFNDENLFLNDFFTILFALSLSVVPISIGIAILRYRLWDIDFVINRSLVYGALTILLIALFGGSLLVINVLFRSFASGPLLAVAIAAAAFGALFQPARRGLQRFVDRRFYNIQIDYNKTPVPIVGNTNVLKQTHFGQYQSLELIGRGGMAEIYKSIHPTLGVPVAIKVLPANLAEDLDFRKRFTREAQIVARLQHRHIIRVFDYGEADGTNYIVMEYIDGNDLAQYLAKQGRLSLTDALPLLRGIAEALDYAHAQGLVHRDVKPSNVLLDGRRDPLGSLFPLLTDFGIAKILDDGVTRFTETGGMLGTFDYIAPEQIQGAANLNAQADVYSFGVLAYQMLTGMLPFQHNNPGALLMAHMLQPAPDPREVVPDMSNDSAYAIQRAMSKQPHERFATAAEFVMALV